MNTKSRVILWLCLLSVGQVNAQRLVSLQEAIRIASTQNIFLQSEQLNIKMAEGDVITARIRPNPILNNQSLQQLNSALYPANTEWSSNKNRQVWWQFTKPIQWPGQRSNKIAHLESHLVLAQKTFQETQRNVFNDVASKWLDAWYARKSLDLILQAQSNIDTLVSINTYRLKNQVINQTEYLRTRLIADQYRTERNKAQAAYEMQVRSLAQLLNDTLAFDIDTNTQNAMYVSFSSSDSILQHAWMQRSDLQAVLAEKHVAETNRTYQKSQAWPQPELGVIWNPQNSVPYLGTYGTLKIPLFDRNQGEIYKSSVYIEQMQKTEQYTRSKIQSEVVNAYHNYTLYQNNVHEYQQILSQSESILNSVKFAYLRGGTTIIDFLEAQRTWLETRRAYYETLQNYQSAYIQLLFASGLIQNVKP